MNPLLWAPLVISIRKSQSTLHAKLPRHPFLPPPMSSGPPLLPSGQLGVHGVPRNFCFSWENGEVKWWRGL